MPPQEVLLVSHSLDIELLGRRNAPEEAKLAKCGRVFFWLVLFDVSFSSLVFCLVLDHVKDDIKIGEDSQFWELL